MADDIAKHRAEIDAVSMSILFHSHFPTPAFPAAPGCVPWPADPEDR
ncbi:MAG TPA: hypothetical protein VIW78_12100 [Burkholderiales bacterium]